MAKANIAYVVSLLISCPLVMIMNGHVLTRNESGDETHPEFRSLSLPAQISRFKMHGCVLTGMSQARRSIPSSAACLCAGSALTCWGRRPGTCRGTGKMKAGMTSTAASVLDQLLGGPAPSCTAPRMAARRASALGQPSHLVLLFTCSVRSRKEKDTGKLPASSLISSQAHAEAMCV